MLLSITNSAPNATDLGYILHKHPANLHTADTSFGKAHVFYPQADPTRCTASLLVEVDPVELVRGAHQLADYVNDRPYVASSFLTVALGRVFGTALSGTCAKRPELVDARLHLSIDIPVVKARGGAELIARLFTPLGYQTQTDRIPLDDRFPEWGESPYYRVTLQTEARVQDVLCHLYVLLPVLDDQKHYYIGEAEVEKLLRRGAGWLSTHPERNLIVERYLKRRPSLMDLALTQLLDDESAAVEAAESKTEQSAHLEQTLERPMTLHTQRLHLVAEKLKALGAKSVLDLGCGEGRLLRRLVADRTFDRICGMDVSHRSLEMAAARLHLDRLPDAQRQRIQLIQGSLLYRDHRLAGFDGAALAEVIEHLDPSRLAALERVVFEFAHPRHVIVTTPNSEYNVLFPTLPAGQMRHGDHRFEWTRSEFANWAGAVATRFGYRVTLEPIGPVDPQHGAPSQAAIFSLPEGPVQ